MRVFFMVLMVIFGAISGACGSDPEQANDISGEATDVTTSEPKDVAEMRDGDELGDTEVPADIEEVTPQDVALGDSLELQDVDGDTTTDDCSVPQEGCPCDPELGSQECCVEVAKGLSCSNLNGRYVWGEFYDCGCWPVPECDTYPLYQLCESK